MFRTLMYLTMLLCVAPAWAGGDPDPKDTPGPFEGTWVFSSGKAGGRYSDPEDFDGHEKIWKGGKMITRLHGKDTYIDTVTFDSTKKPGHVDIVQSAGPLKGKTLKGIYKVDGDTLTLCWGEPGKARPTRFESPICSEVILEVWKKRKDK